MIAKCTTDLRQDPKCASPDRHPYWGLLSTPKSAAPAGLVALGLRRTDIGDPEMSRDSVTELEQFGLLAQKTTSETGESGL